MDLSNLDANSIVPAVAGLVGAVIGALASLSGAYYLEGRRINREKMSLATSIKAELQAVLHVETVNAYRDMYQDVLNQLCVGQSVPMPDIGYSTDPARSVAYTNLSRVGVLPEPVPTKLIRLLYVYEVVVADRQAMDTGKWNDQELKLRKEMLKKHLNVYDDLVSLASEIIDDLDTAG